MSFCMEAFMQLPECLLPEKRPAHVAMPAFLIAAAVCLLSPCRCPAAPAHRPCL